MLLTLKCRRCGSEGYAFLYDDTCGDCLVKERDAARLSAERWAMAAEEDYLENAVLKEDLLRLTQERDATRTAARKILTEAESSSAALKDGLLRLTTERDRLRALIEKLLVEIENTGDHDWWHSAKADYEAIEKG
jgi:ribosomal protein L37E